MARATRRKAREIALQSLYWVISTGDSVDVVVDEMAMRSRLPPETKTFVLDLCRKTAENRARFEAMIARTAENWDLSRMARVDRIILFIALTEFFFFDDIPFRVSINEAIELGKRFGGDKSGAFINGLLHTLASQEEIVTCRSISVKAEEDADRGDL